MTTASSAAPVSGLLLGAREVFAELRLQPDGGVAVDSETWRRGEPFRRQRGDWIYYASPHDGHCIHALAVDRPYEYVFAFGPQGWTQQGRWTAGSIEVDATQFPLFRDLRLKRDGTVRIGGLDYPPGQPIRYGADRGERVRRRAGLAQPLFLLNDRDEYVALAFLDDQWSLFNPQRAVERPTPWRQAPGQSWLPAVLVDAPDLDLLPDGSVRIDGMTPADEAGFLLRVGSWHFARIQGTGRPLYVRNLESQDEWRLQYLDGRWCTEVVWCPLPPVDLVIADSVRLGPGFLQVIPLFRTFAADAEVPAVGNDVVRLFKPRGVGEVLRVDCEGRQFLFAHHAGAWYVLAATQSILDLDCRLLNDQTPIPPYPEGLNLALLLRREWGLAIPRWLARFGHPWRRFYDGFSRLTAKPRVWITAVDPRFFSHQKTRLGALDTEDVPGLALYPGGAIQIDGRIFGRGDAIDLDFGLRRVRRDPARADCLEILRLYPEHQLWSVLTVRFRGGRWQQQVSRDRSDRLRALVARTIARTVSRIVLFLVRTTRRRLPGIVRLIGEAGRLVRSSYQRWVQRWG